MAYLNKIGLYYNLLLILYHFDYNRDGIFAHFISSVQSKLHIVLCMSPVGDAFRARCRMFPSLVNCCTIDWFTEWPRLVLRLMCIVIFSFQLSREALMSVAVNFFENVELGDDAMKVKQTVALSLSFCVYSLKSLRCVW